MHRITTLILAILCVAASTSRLEVQDIDRRIEQWQPTAKERAWQRIGWAADIRHALQLARAHNRPVFLFTHDGRLGFGRC